MNRLLVTLSGLLIAGSACAQFPVLLPDTLVDRSHTWRNSVGVEGVFDVNSSALRNELLLGLYLGQELDRDLRDRSRGGQIFSNRAGYAIAARASWIGAACSGKLHGWRPTVSMAHHDVLGLRYTRDLYNLTFFGNAGYADRTADLSGTAHTAMRYQTIGAGLVNVEKGRSVRLDLVKGQTLSATDLRTATLYTAPDGRLLEIDLNGQYWQSDTAGSGIERVNGIGVALSGAWRITLETDPGPLALSFFVEDLGAVHWNNGSQYLTKDTLIAFQGLEVNNVFDLDGVLLGEDQLLDTFGLRTESTGSTRLLPFRAGISLNMELGPGWQGGFGVEQRYLPSFVPQATLSVGRRIVDRALIAANLGYGGFGGFRAGASVVVRIGDHLCITAALSQVPGPLSDQARGAGASFGIRAGW